MKTNMMKHIGAMRHVSQMHTSRSSIADWAFNIMVMLFATSTIAQPFVIPTGSMESTLLVGDHVLVDKLAYSPHGALSSKVLPYEDIKHGDIIVFRWPVDIAQNYVKRVIGMPGDRIRIEGKEVYRNGVKLVEPYVQHIDDYRVPYRDDFPAPPVVLGIYPQGRQMLEENVHDGELVVPEGKYFALGDNRDNSSDSRFWGFVPRENITGKPLLVYWSYQASTDDLTSYSVDHFVDVALHFFTKTRWDRMFKLVRAE
jgi:signal peptidase I